MAKAGLGKLEVMVSAWVTSPLARPTRETVVAAAFASPLIRFHPASSFRRPFADASSAYGVRERDVNDLG